MRKYICIHGHFYQPPRENAWLETVELQESASPFHDWNERINFECYAQNASSRILDQQGQIIDIVNNYERISFNFGPTLLSWLELNDPETYKAIQEADKRSLKQFGFGNAVAQVHSHLILPLCNEQDKVTQTAWGIKDFEKRFGRKPEGIWLAETAVDTASLEVLAAQGILYTIASPRQAAAVKPLSANNWQNVDENSLDTRRPYLCKLPSGKQIAIFFYDGKIAQSVAFSGLLNNGKVFAEHLNKGFRPDNGEAQLVHIATDGESYGHHHRHGDMALAWCLDYLSTQDDVELINYAAFLHKFPPTWEVRIHENSSWSCVHGVERWRNDCGCSTGGHAHWNQQWRAPLREALNWLRDKLIPIYEVQAKALFHDPYQARNAYIDVILDRSEANINAFFAAQALRPLTAEERVHALRLLELQRNALYMFTSCGWFFDEISGIETNQILQYACRAIHFAQQVDGVNLEPEFIQRLANAPSNLPQILNGARNYELNVIPSRVDLERVGMHYAVASIFESEPDKLPLFNYQASSDQLERYRAGSHVLSIGRTTVKSKITLSEKQFCFAVLYLGQHNIIGNISLDMPSDTFLQMQESMRKAFQASNLAELIGLMQTYFGGEKYSIKHLFKAEKQKILHKTLNDNMQEAEAYFRSIYEDNYQLMSAFLDSEIPVPKAYSTAAAYVLNSDIDRYLANNRLSLKELRRLAYELKKWKIEIVNPELISLKAGQRLAAEVEKLAAGTLTLEQLIRLNEILSLLREMKFIFNKHKSQNLYHKIAQAKELSSFHDVAWLAQFTILGGHLGMNLN
jgi:alpha-amylase/alpha-mannosidase (GH57 family)